MSDRMRQVAAREQRENNREGQEEQQDETPSFWFSWLGIKGGARGRHITHLAYVTILAAGICVAIWAHDQNTRDRSVRTQQLSGTLIELVGQSNKNQRFMACIASRPETERKAEFEVPTSFCNRLSQ